MSIDDYKKNGVFQKENCVIELSEEQKDAIQSIKKWFFKSHKQTYVLAGSAGTGKSTIINYIEESLNLSTYQVCVCAFTGKACSVLKRKGVTKAQTIHSTIYEYYEEEDKDGNKIPLFKRSVSLPYKLVIVDEASMVSKEIYEDLCSYGVKVLFIGDHKQLPPVSGTFNILDNPNYILTKILRQQEDSPILKLAMKAINGEIILDGDYGNNIRKIHMCDFKDDEVLNYDQVIVGTNALKDNFNTVIRDLKGHISTSPMFGEKMVVLKNYPSKGMFNGQIIYLREDSRFIKKRSQEFYKSSYIDELEYEDIVLQLASTNKNLAFTFDVEKNSEYIHLDYGYAITAHKSQGSSWNNVLIVDTKFGIWKSQELYNRLLYTCITRSRKELKIMDVVKRR